MRANYNDKKTYISIAAEDCASRSLVGGDSGEATGEMEESKTKEKNDEDMNNEDWGQDIASDSEMDEDEMDEDEIDKRGLKSAGGLSEYAKTRQKNIAENQKLLDALKLRDPLKDLVQKPAAKKRAVKEKCNDKPVERRESLRNKNQ
jgi:hypothetical protein